MFPEETPEEIIKDLVAKIQFLVDNWPGIKNGFTFPDGDYWPVKNYPIPTEPYNGEDMIG